MLSLDKFGGFNKYVFNTLCDVKYSSKLILFHSENAFRCIKFIQNDFFLTALTLTQFYKNRAVSLHIVILLLYFQ